jgi:hypothetical protein
MSSEIGIRRTRVHIVETDELDRAAAELPRKLPAIGRPPPSSWRSSLRACI